MTTAQNGHRRVAIVAMLYASSNHKRWTLLFSTGKKCDACCSVNNYNYAKSKIYYVSTVGMQ